MAKKLSRDQKRKAKLKKRAERSHRHESLAYDGEKYRTEKYVPIQFAAERGVFEAHVLFDRSLTDDDIQGAIESLVIQLRGNLPLLPTAEESRELPREKRDAIIACIRRNWWDLFGESLGPSRDDYIGVLRTILSSVEFWRSPGRDSTKFIEYLEDFLADMGVAVRVEKSRRGVSSEPSENPKALESNPEAD